MWKTVQITGTTWLALATVALSVAVPAAPRSSSPMSIDSSRPNSPMEVDGVWLNGYYIDPVSCATFPGLGANKVDAPHILPPFKTPQDYLDRKVIQSMEWITTAIEYLELLGLKKSGTAIPGTRTPEDVALDSFDYLFWLLFPYSHREKTLEQLKSVRNNFFDSSSNKLSKATLENSKVRIFCTHRVYKHEANTRVWTHPGSNDLPYVEGQDEPISENYADKSSTIMYGISTNPTHQVNEKQRFSGVYFIDTERMRNSWNYRLKAAKAADAQGSLTSNPPGRINFGNRVNTIKNDVNFFANFQKYDTDNDGLPVSEIFAFTTLGMEPMLTHEFMHTGRATQGECGPYTTPRTLDWAYSWSQCIQLPFYDLPEGLQGKPTQGQPQSAAHDTKCLCNAHSLTYLVVGAALIKDRLTMINSKSQVDQMIAIDVEGKFQSVSLTEWDNFLKQEETRFVMFTNAWDALLRDAAEHNRRANIPQTPNINPSSTGTLFGMDALKVQVALYQHALQQAASAGNGQVQSQSSNVNSNANWMGPGKNQWSTVKADIKLTNAAENWIKTLKFDPKTGCVISTAPKDPKLKQPTCQVPKRRFWRWETLQVSSQQKPPTPQKKLTSPTGGPNQLSTTNTASINSGANTSTKNLKKSGSGR
ncbi:hypothetical protein EX30DRAFT_55050 [Ascodesmis nigricans]|uniref:EF-hand domain-containing protein n=1 Tax=Ascodesmis nigricans TaxID=341454 RepID=A0A4S2MVN6_9PEZI|nr:hypothetical protein EX30DRAFT_55050 [Ascodesmis nigricans]